ncbi:hypothetical protein ABU614_02580 [Lysobacter firmicutimachus]|uniref:Ubiquitin-like domain-containing protein n=1 Tax=Lysobacter firmicutimachus TaxID=1792846 RepID=A0AAU8MX35_9GAMM
MLVTIAFAGEPDRDIVLRLAPETSLLRVREQLAAKAGMQPGERFRLGRAGLHPTLEAETTVGQAIDKDQTLTVRPAPTKRAESPAKTPAQARPALRPIAPEARPAEARWGLRNEADAPDLLPQLQGRLAGVNARTPDEFAALPLETVQALFATRRLDRGLRFSAELGDSVFGARSPRSPAVYRHPQRPPHSGGVSFTSRWRLSATASRVLHELHTRSIHNANAGGGVNGFGLGADFRRDLERLQRSEVTAIHLVEETIVPKVAVTLDPDQDLDVAPELVEAVDAALAVRGGRRSQYQALHERVFAGFGYFFPCETLLGGVRMRTLSTTSEDLREQQQFLAGFGFGAAAKDVPTSHGPASGDIGYARSESRLSRHRHIRQLRQQDVRTVGGHPALGLADDLLLQWMAGLDAVELWAAIGHRRLVPILRFLPRRQRDQCVGVIEPFARSDLTARFTVLDMAAYVAPFNRALLDELM